MTKDARYNVRNVLLAIAIALAFSLLHVVRLALFHLAHLLGVLNGT